MATPTWRIGAFADRFSSEAREIGYAYRMQSRALEALYATAGQRTMMAMPCCSPGGGDCCSCPKPPEDDGFAAIYPEAAMTLCEDRAFAASLLDITADQDLEDVVGAVGIATELHDAGELAALYVPAVPMKKMPDGTDAPARCPICGSIACPTCGECCSCCDVETDAAAMQ